MGDAEAGAAVDTIVERLVSGTDDLGHDFALLCHAHVPELNAADGILPLTVASGQANFRTFFNLIRARGPAGQCELPDPIVNYARDLVPFGLTSSPLLGAYRVALEGLWEFWTSQLEDRVDDPATRGRALRFCMDYSFGYVERVSTVVGEVHAAEAQRWHRSPLAVRVDTVRQILDGTVQDPERASRRLGYELGRWQLAMVLQASRPAGSGLVVAAPAAVRSDDPPERVLQHAAVELAKAAGGGQPLVLPAGPGAAWAWAPSVGPFDPAVLADLARRVELSGVGVSLGGPAHGMAGFRHGHEQALHALRFVDRTACPAAGWCTTTTSWRHRCSPPTSAARGTSSAASSGGCPPATSRAPGCARR